MPRCTQCGHEFAVSQDFRCPACEQDWRGPAETAASDAPAHLAVLEKGGVAPREPKPRIVSTAGPAMPVLPNKNDSVPPGWMARLEAARMVAKSSGADPMTTSAADPSAPAEAARPAPPPLPTKKKAKGPTSSLESKPAHLLVAQLQADERRRRADEQVRLTELFDDKPAEGGAPAAIAEVKVDLPTAPPKKKRVPDWMIVALLGALVAGGFAYAYTSAQEAPAPTAEVDPALEEAKVRREKAVAALERGHQLALDGKAGADAAISAYEEALALEPDLASAERGIAIAYAAKDDDAMAVKHYRRYLELAPDAKDAAQVKKIIARWKKAQKKKR